MILPPGLPGVAFGAAADGDGRRLITARRAMAAALGIPDAWAFVHQVHGREAREARAPGLQGDGDALFTTLPGLPLAIGTADCLPVAVLAPGAVGLAHVGWRGAVAGVLPALRAAMQAAGLEPRQAAIGPGIGPCCYEVGPEVLTSLGAFRSRTRRGTDSVDLAAAAAAALEGLEVWPSGICTFCGEGFHSFRRDRGRERQVAVAWLA